MKEELLHTRRRLHLDYTKEEVLRRMYFAKKDHIKKVFVKKEHIKK
jgi:hypothetical protein